jgi:hypothetical protein
MLCDILRTEEDTHNIIARTDEKYGAGKNLRIFNCRRAVYQLTCLTHAHLMAVGSCHRSRDSKVEIQTVRGKVILVLK